MSKDHSKNTVRGASESLFELKKTVASLTKENADLKARLNTDKRQEDGDLSAAYEALYEENYLLKEKLRAAEARLDEYLQSEKKSAERLNKADKRADELNSQAMYKYLLELKAIKLLCDKFSDVYGEELSEEKRRLTDLLAEFLKDVDTEGYLYSAKETAQKVSDTLKPDPTVSKEAAEFYGEDVFFDLEAVQNPGEDLDLKTLCEELGIFGGNK